MDGMTRGAIPFGGEEDGAGGEADYKDGFGVVVPGIFWVLWGLDAQQQSVYPVPTPQTQ